MNYPIDLSKLAVYYGDDPANPAPDPGAQAFGAPPPPAPANDAAPPASPPANTNGGPSFVDLAKAYFSGAKPADIANQIAPPAPPAPVPDLPGNMSSPYEDTQRQMSVAPLPGTAPGVSSSEPNMSVPPAPAPKATPKPAASSGGVSVPSFANERNALYGTFPREQQAIQDLADAQKAKNDALAAGMAVVGADQVQHAKQMQLQAAQQDQIFKAYQDETQKQLDLVRSRQVDPGRLMKDGGMKLAALIGGVLGGLYQGINHLQSNPFLDDLHSTIQHDIGLQEQEIQRDTNAVAERKNLLANMMAVYKDKTAAEAATYGLYLEGFKTQLQSEVQQYDSPAIQARAAAAMNGVNRQFASLKLNDKMQDAARAAAAAAFQRAQAQKAFENMLKYEEMVSGRLKALGAGEKTQRGLSLNERFVPMMQDPQNPGVVHGYLARNAEEAINTTKQLYNLKQLNALANQALAIRAEEGMLGRATNNPLIELYTPEWKTKIREKEQQLVGAIKEGDKLGALDNGVERFVKPITGNLDSVGTSADIKLRELIDTTNQKMQMLSQQLGGQQAVKLPGEDIRMVGGVYAGPNAETGSLGVRREAP